MKTLITLTCLVILLNGCLAKSKVKPSNDSSTATTLSETHASTRKFIRFYKLDRIEQSTRIILGKKKTSVAGCHNFIVKKVRVQRINYVGYQSCSIYAKKDCAAGSILTVSQYKKVKPTTTLTEGLSWYPITDHARGEKIKSWYCE